MTPTHLRLGLDTAHDAIDVTAQGRKLRFTLRCLGSCLAFEGLLSSMPPSKR